MPKTRAGIASPKLRKFKFAPLTLDFTFKKAFAREQCKELLLFLLNTFLERVLKEPIKDVKVIHWLRTISRLPEGIPFRDTLTESFRCWLPKSWKKAFFNGHARQPD